MKTYLRAELDIARRKLADALERIAALEAELAEARAAAERLRVEIQELEQGPAERRT
jgi:chromosome segregation ATPase